MGKLLGFIVSYCGIEANPKNLKDIFRMNPSTTLKDVQKLTGSMAALSRFVSQLGERAMSFYKLLKKQDKFQWTPEAQQAFNELKKFLTNPPVLVPTMPEEPLLLYIAATSHVVSIAIVVERQEEGFEAVLLTELKFGSPRVRNSTKRSLNTASWKI